MYSIQQIGDFIDQFAPRELAEEWDNVGLLLGDAGRRVERIMTCLTVTPQSAQEAVDEQVDLVIAHHPLPFRPLRRITSQSPEGRLVLQLAESRIALISPHTCFDSAARGINQLLAEAVGLQEIRPLIAVADVPPEMGSGRWGCLTEARPLLSIIGQFQKFLGIRNIRRVGDRDRLITKMAVGCGSGGEFLPAADRAGCELLVTGETNFHTCLEAMSRDLCLVLTGHYASERFAVEQLAVTLQGQFPELTIWASRRETDPLSWENASED